MKTRIINILLPFLLFSFGFLAAQNDDFGDEKIHLFTDRTLYVCEDEIQFSAFIENGHDQSKVLYIELIFADGTALSSQKHLISSKQSSGKIEIPKDLLSGTYYLKAYTKYLRNFGANQFSYIALKIVNPYSNEFLSGNEWMLLDTVWNQNTVSIGAAHQTNLEYKLDLNELPIPKHATFSIVPAFSFQSSNSVKPEEPTNAKFYFPETDGISLSGKLIDSLSKEPLPFREINLSIVAQKNFRSTRTNASGQFFFALPVIFGSQDVFISTKKEKEVHPIIFVDKDYDNSVLQLPTPPFVLTEKERKTALLLAQSIQIRHHFYTQSTPQFLDTFSIPFYGQAENTLYLDNYIAFETLEEYFTELPGLVKVKSLKKEKHLSIVSSLRDMSFYLPLVLMDWVAVEDINRILAVSPRGIEKVEIVPFPYVYGDFIYGGIISILSRNKDFGGISLPKTGLFFNYDFFHPESAFDIAKTASSAPDTRNTLYWTQNKSRNTLPLQSIHFDAKFSDIPYWLIVQGVDENGNEIRKIYPIELN